jgi:hypothetical protein
MIRTVSAFSLALAASLAAAAGAAELPLPRGFYVSGGTACAAASEATLTLLHRDGLGGARDFCAFETIAAESSARFRVRERCADHQDPRRSALRDTVYDILGPGRFRRTSGPGMIGESQHCPQDALPEPWRSNDISDVLR